MALDPRVQPLLGAIKGSRSVVLEEVSRLTQLQGSTKTDAASWSIQEILEHLALAERGGFDLICTAAESFRAGEPVWSGDSATDGLHIEEIIERTWKTKGTLQIRPRRPENDQFVCGQLTCVAAMTSGWAWLKCQKAFLWKR